MLADSKAKHEILQNFICDFPIFLQLTIKMDTNICLSTSNRGNPIVIDEEYTNTKDK